MIEETAYHEAGHAVVQTLEECHIGPVASVTIIPNGEVLGAVYPAEHDVGKPTPRKLRAAGRTAVAGVVAARLAGFASGRLGGSDLQLLASSSFLSGFDAKFVRECLMGAELQLRLHWGAVVQVAEWTRAAGTLQAPYAESLIRSALDRPPRPLMPDSEAFFRLLEGIADVPEFSSQIAAALGSARTAP